MEYNNMSGKGNEPGNMSPKVQDYQPKMGEYAGMQEGKTTQYIPKRDRIQVKAASQVKGQAFKGRYD